ncbi:MAG: thymidylate kinase [Anaerolineaceae bacterium]|nr:thymidylate kinase [Anaerolineaceae bacterium]
MTQPEFYGAGFPYKKIKDLPGKLIVLEGTDGVGRSTQVGLVRQWLEDEGYAVTDTGLRRSPLCQVGLEAAKMGHTLSPLTMSLFYATDFADRLENQILPALKAGFYVLSDRYFYSVIARDEIRGADPLRERAIYGFALKPDIIIYLKADVPTLVSRMVHGRGFNHWESGMDIRCSDNLYDSFCSYQSSLINEFDKMAEEYAFQTVDANRPFQDVFNEIKTLIRPLLVKE